MAARRGRRAGAVVGATARKCGGAVVAVLAVAVAVAAASPASPAGPAGASAAAERAEAGVGPRQDADVACAYGEWRPLLGRQLAERRLDDPVDLYKFLFQGVMGPRHAGLTEAAALAWLEREWAELPAAGTDTAAATEPLAEPLRPDGRLVRLNLLPLRELVTAGLPPADRAAAETGARRALARAFAATAREHRPRPRLLACLWTAAVADTSLWRGRLPADSLAALGHRLAAAGWPAVHHGERYVERWRPHYRVVDPRRLPAAWGLGPGAAGGGGGRRQRGGQPPQPPRRRP